jgi:hypothetical protein
MDVTAAWLVPDHLAILRYEKRSTRAACDERLAHAAFYRLPGRYGSRRQCGNRNQCHFSFHFPFNLSTFKPFNLLTF